MAGRLINGSTICMLALAGASAAVGQVKVKLLLSLLVLVLLAVLLLLVRPVIREISNRSGVWALTGLASLTASYQAGCASSWLAGFAQPGAAIVTWLPVVVTAGVIWIAWRVSLRAHLDSVS